MSRSYKIQVSAISDIGIIRKNNEDNLYVSGQFMVDSAQGKFGFSAVEDTNSYICAICDGMGGENSGERASYIAINNLYKDVNNPIFSSKELPEKISYINDCLSKTNSEIYELASDAPELKGMGTTFVCFVVSDGCAAAMNVGDSRAYLFRDGALLQLTTDHSESERQIRLGIITREQARGHKSRFILNRYLGMPPDEGVLEAEVKNMISIQKGDHFLLCSDGLTDMVADESIQNILKNSLSAVEAANNLFNEAIKNGGRDNVTVINLVIKEIDEK